MQKSEIKFENLTLAQIARMELSKNGIPSHIIKITRKGCAHALSIKPEKLAAAYEILKSKNIRYLH